MPFLALAFILNVEQKTSFCPLAPVASKSLQLPIISLEGRVEWLVPIARLCNVALGPFIQTNTLGGTDIKAAGICTSLGACACFHVTLFLNPRDKNCH